ncbi:MAG: prepilin-type N-terminal cleavage/methylation domain-containing protein [Candidatus Riflebacteria bacterium]|nr:prepilin-type N-terminal cleavage/methylation domain-containing protein [Candidatus Riflebacteria bacterium]
MKSTARLGFSLVELLIALAIILAVVTIATGVFQPLVAEQQVDVLKANLRTIRQAIYTFYNDNGRYPYEGHDEFGNVVAFLDNQTSELVQGAHDGKGTYPVRRRRYLMSIPPDPTATSDITRTAGWKLIFAEPALSNRAIPEVMGVRDVKSLNPSFQDL